MEKAHFEWSWNLKRIKSKFNFKRELNFLFGKLIFYSQIVFFDELNFNIWSFCLNGWFGIKFLFNSEKFSWLHWTLFSEGNLSHFHAMLVVWATSSTFMSNRDVDRWLIELELIGKYCKMFTSTIWQLQLASSVRLGKFHKKYASIDMPFVKLLTINFLG